MDKCPPGLYRGAVTRRPIDQWFGVLLVSVLLIAFVGLVYAYAVSS